MEESERLFPPLPPPVRVPLTVVPEHSCPYLPDREVRTRAFAAESFPGELYHDFMDRGFRRSGRVIYQPACVACQACRPIRIPAATFRASKSQRRCWRANGDLRHEIGEVEATDEKFELYRRYVARRHKSAEESREGFESFLCESPVETVEMRYRDGAGRLLAVGICDVCSRSLSSVYFYFDPDEARRGLGTYGALVEIETARRMGIPHYYMGYWIAGCGAMEYKRGFRPCEILGPDGVWRPG